MSGRPGGSAIVQRVSLSVVAVVMVLIVLLANAARPAAAAQFHLMPASLASISVADRCTSSVTATHGALSSDESTTVTVADLGPACGGRDLALTLYGSDGAALTSGATLVAPDAVGSVSVAVPAYRPAEVAGAAVTLGTWGVPATWTYTPVVPEALVSCTVLNDPTGSKSCDVTDVRIDAWGYPQLDTFNFYATVTSPSATEDVEWQLTINLAHPDLQVLANLADSNNAVTTAPGWSCASMPMLELRGQADVSTKYVGGGKTVTVWMMGKAAPASTSGGSLFNCS